MSDGSRADAGTLDLTSIRITTGQAAWLVCVSFALIGTLATSIYQLGQCLALVEKVSRRVEVLERAKAFAEGVERGRGLSREDKEGSWETKR